MLSHDIMIDLLYAAMTTRARLDPAVEREELERQAMKKLSMREVDPAAQSVADALAGRVGDSVPYMTFDELAAYLADSD